jgi:SAM-dependent methyltransferase
MTDKYETGVLLEQYLDFHFRGEEDSYLPHHPLPKGVLSYPRRCADWTIRHAARFDRALDLGCAVGGSSLVLARDFGEVIGIDFSNQFIEAARTLAETGVFRQSEKEWSCFPTVGNGPEAVPDFRVGDACALPEDLGVFDAVMMANLLCRLPDPAACLQGIRRHVREGSVIILFTPCSWDEAFTPKEKQLVPTLPALKELLGSWCDLLEIRDFPFVLKVHERRAEFTVALGTAWRVR